MNRIDNHFDSHIQIYEEFVPQGVWGEFADFYGAAPSCLGCWK